MIDYSGNSDCSVLFGSNCSVVRTQMAFRMNNENRNHPSPRSIRLIVAKFRSIDNIDSVRQDVIHNPQKFVRRSEELKISKSSLWRAY